MVFATWFMLAPRRCISSVRRQQGMRLDERYVLYLQTAGLYHLARLNDRWLRLDEPLVSAFVKRWRPEMHTFHMPFGECTIMLQDVAYHLGLPVDGHYGSAALAWLYRCMCRVTNRHVVKLAGPLQLLQSWIFWRFPSFRPTGYDAFSWPLASRWSGYNPRISNKGPQVQMARLKIDLLQPRDFIWMPYSALDVIQVVHPEVLEPRHTMLWRCVTSLIYFAVVEWHQERAEHILQFDIVADPGPSHDFLTWWHQHGKRFLSPEMLLGDPRGIPIPDEATQRGAG
ncbi:serine/threonine-protein phosphatase 7 long form homolog [Arachis hypogaea]|uniref:serine/threonine-protein phosphatase 7 long form homolog n=1 Tax=Arachis hypogaea TaxID=3818 RepID=UPI003B22402A